MGTQCTIPKSTSQASRSSVSAGRFSDRVTPGNKIISHGSNYIVEETPQSRFVVKRFYYETRSQTMELNFADKALSTLDGPATQWLDNGKIWTQGNYKNGKKVGAWIEYSFGFKDNYLNKGVYSNNQKNGIWTELDTLGKKSMESLFNMGDLVNRTYFNPDGSVDSAKSYRVMQDTFDIQVEPAYPCDPKFASTGKDCNLKSMYSYIGANLKYPDFAKEQDISGTAILSFVVDKEGNLVDIIVLQGICDAIKAECVRMVSNMPRWSPGSANGHPVKVRYTLPLRFKLE